MGHKAIIVQKMIMGGRLPIRSDNSGTSTPPTAGHKPRMVMITDIFVGDMARVTVKYCGRKIEPMTNEPTIRQLIPQHSAMLRVPSMAQNESDDSLAAPMAGAAARGGSSTSHQINSARISPGTPAMKNAACQE